LSNTSIRLSKAYKVVEEQTELLKDHQQTEQQLSQSAKVLLENLTSTLSEVEALHQKLGKTFSFLISF